MTTTYVLPISTSGVDKTLEFTCFDRATLGPGVTIPVKNDGEETTYRFIDGNPAKPSSIRVGHYPPSVSGVTTNDSVKIRAIGIKTDGDGVETEFPVEATIAVADGSHGQLSRADIAALLMMALSVYLEPAGVDDEASTTALTRLSFGVTDIINVTFA